MSEALETHAAARFDASRLAEFTRQIFEAAGFSSDDSALATDVLIWASLRGVDTHGIRNLKRYYIDGSGVGRRDGVIIPDAVTTTERQSDNVAALNANGGLGLSVSVRAMQEAIGLAETHGVGLVTVRNSTHFGAAGYYAQMATERDMIGFASTGYLFPHGQDKAVVPFGGLLPMLSTNPIAMAFPADAQPPFLLDMSTSVIPVNRIEMLEELGQAIPSGWALDEHSQPTTNPRNVHGVEPLGGATRYGGHKGYGLALASWIMTGLLSGAWRTDPAPDRVLGTTGETRHGYAQEGIGHFFAAVRLDLFGDPLAFKRGLDAMIVNLNDSPPAAGFKSVQVPGQLEQTAFETRSRDGIPVSAATLADLTSLADEFQIPLPAASEQT